MRSLTESAVLRQYRSLEEKDKCQDPGAKRTQGQVLVHSGKVDGKKGQDAESEGQTERTVSVIDDLEPDEKIKIYDKGVQVRTKEGKYNLLVDYRSGDMWAPKIEQTEALKLIAEKFVEYVENGGTVVNDGVAGLNIVKMLVASNKSLQNRGETVYL